jgi:hypothetical protein
MRLTVITALPYPAKRNRLKQLAVFNNQLLKQLTVSG